MKKFILPALFLGAMAFGSTSCKKDYTCECSVTINGVTTSASSTAKLKKKDAEAWCTGTGTSAATCKLK